MSGQHSPDAPSSMARRVQCPGSHQLEQLFPEPDDTPEAMEGTAAHWVVAELAAGRTVTDGQIAPNGVVIDDEMIEGAQMMVDALTDGGPLHLWTIEQPVAIPRVSPRCWGTPDARRWIIPRRRLRVADFKYGHGFVEVFENLQLIAYACGALSEAGIDGLEEQAVLVELVIVQPRNYHRDGPVRMWSVNAADLRAHVNAMVAACELSLQPNAPLRLGPECEFCPGRHACPTLTAAALDACDQVGTSTPLGLTAQQAAAELRRLNRTAELLHARITGLEQQVTSALRGGVPVPHFHLEQGAGRETWKIAAEQVKVIGQMYGLQLIKEKPVTPKQARELGVPTEGLAHIPGGSVKLVADDPLKARKIFGGFKP